MTEPTLFGDDAALPPPTPAPQPPRGGTPRLRPVQRQQGEIRTASFDQLLSPDYDVRSRWDYVVGRVDVRNSGNDSGELAPLLEQLQERYGSKPAELLVDGGFTTPVFFGPNRQHGNRSRARSVGTKETSELETP